MGTDAVAAVTMSPGIRQRTSMTGTAAAAMVANMMMVAWLVRLRAKRGRSSQKICAAKKKDASTVSDSPRPRRNVRQSTPAKIAMPTTTSPQLATTSPGGQRRRWSATMTGIVTQ